MEQLKEEQVKKVYDTLEAENNSREGLDAAKKETEESDYTDIETIEPTDASVNGIDFNSVSERREDYMDAFTPYNLSDEDAIKMFNLIQDYKKGLRVGLYERLPEEFKNIVEGLRKDPETGKRASRDNATRVILDSFINDAKIGAAIDEYTRDMNETMSSMSQEYSLIYTEAIEDIFKKIDEIKTTNPEQAEKLERIKQSFEDAESLVRVKDYLNSSKGNLKFLKKGVTRFKDNVFYFNKKVNVTEITVPDIGDLPEVIKMHLPQYDIETINMFVFAMMQTCIHLDLEGDENIHNIAYVYRIVDNIYSYKFIDSIKDSTASRYNTVIDGITSCLDIINSK